MSVIITLVVAVLVVCLVWYAISLIPSPPAPTFIQPVLWILLLLVFAYWLWIKFAGSTG